MQIKRILANNFDLFLYGPSGIGKTVFIRDLLQLELDRANFIRINCILYKEKNELLYNIIENLNALFASKSYKLGKSAKFSKFLEQLQVQLLLIMNLI